jgi:hypothetical protein
MNFSKKRKFFLFILLITLNIILRLPSIPHERGSPDEYTMHSLANSLSAFGHANWWAHPSSIFGFYPYSYASSTAFIFSGISQTTGINMELIAWIFTAILGVFIMFSAYLLAGQIKDDDFFKFLLAFILTLSSGALTYLTWQISARGFFLTFMPLFIFCLLKSRRFAIRFGAITFIFFILLMASHHYYIFTIPIIISFILILLFPKLKGIFKFSNNFISIALFMGLIGMLLIPFFTGMFYTGSRYAALQNMVENNIRYSGPIIFFAIAGIIYIILKPDREFGEWLFLLGLIITAPSLYIDRYAQFIAAVYLGVFTCVGILNAMNNTKDNKKNIKYIIMFLLIFFVVFSGFYQHWRTNIKSQKTDLWYTEETTYNGAIWVKDYVDNTKRLVGNNDHTSTRVLAVSEVPTIAVPESDITYGFVNSSNIYNVSMNSPFSIAFYTDNPYILPSPYTETDSLRWQLDLYDVDHGYAKNIISRFNLSYYLENTYTERNPLINSLKEKRNMVFYNGRIRIWCIDCSV